MACPTCVRTQVQHTTDGGWEQPKIVPFGPLQLHPAAQVLHYGTCCFEGMKAYLGPNGQGLLFRCVHEACSISVQQCTMAAVKGIGHAAALGAESHAAAVVEAAVAAGVQLSLGSSLTCTTLCLQYPCGGLHTNRELDILDAAKMTNCGLLLLCCALLGAGQK